MSLGTWFRDYIYIPCGGSKVTHKYKLFRNLMIVWVLTGLWHGYNLTFIVWGITYGGMIFFEKIFDIPTKLSMLGKGIYRIGVLFIVNIEWVVFRSESLYYAWMFLKGMFGFGGTDKTARAAFLLKDYAPFILASIICAIPVGNWIKEKCAKHHCDIVYSILSRTILFGMVMISIAFIVAGANNPFVYANF